METDQATESETPVEENSVCNSNGTVCESDFLKYLSTAYGVLRKIFSYLYMDDLENAAEAFESWRPVAEITKSERNVFESIILDKNKTSSKIWNEAAFCISFSSVPVKYLEDEFTKFLVPSAVLLRCVSMAGVIGSTRDLSRLVQIHLTEYDPFTLPDYCCATLRFPRMAEVGIKTFVFKKNTEFDPGEIDSSIPSNAIIKCLLILSVADEYESTYPQKKEFIDFLRKRQNEPFAIGGCMVDNFQNYVKEFEEELSTKYVIFYGDNVVAASTVLQSHLQSFPGINYKIEKLKDKCPSAQRGALIIFRCIGRQKIMYTCKRSIDVSKWEGDALRKYFRKTPIIGCYCYGEYGVEHPFEEDLCNPMHSSDKPERYEYRYSTCIVYVGFKC